MIYKTHADGIENTMLSEDHCRSLSVSGGWLMYYYNSYNENCLYKVKIDGSQYEKLINKMVIFPCVGGEWVYYAEKSEAGVLWCVSTDGREPQRIAEGFIQNYAVVDGWVYYLYANEPYGVRRVHADGTGFEVFYPCKMNLNGSTCPTAC